MFTGIVEEVGEVTEVTDLGDSSRLTVRGPLVTSDASHGASIAVNGVCLTVAGLAGGDSFTADVMHETLRRSSLADAAPGAGVNLERAASVGGRLGGHIVQGHVDTVAEVISRTRRPHWETVRITLPPRVARYAVEKGSITVDGVSLTVSALGTDDAGRGYFEVSLIPTTLHETVLGRAAAGTRVNLEADVVAKYVERIMGADAASPGDEGLPS